MNMGVLPACMHVHHEHIMPLKVRRRHWVYSAWLEVGCWRYATEG